MKFETLPELESMKEIKPLKGWERILLEVVDAYARGECPHLRGEEMPHARGSHSVGAFCSQECLEHFEHEYRTQHSTGENVIRDHPSLYTEASLETYLRPQHALLDHLRLRRTLQDTIMYGGAAEARN